MPKKQLERDFEPVFIKELEKRLPGGIYIKGNSAYRQGIPDRLFLYENKWAAFEVKKDPTARPRPNQPHYVKQMNDMSYAAFVTPENYEEVLDEVQAAFGG